MNKEAQSIMPHAKTEGPLIDSLGVSLDIFLNRQEEVTYETRNNVRKISVHGGSRQQKDKKRTNAKWVHNPNKRKKGGTSKKKKNA